MRSIAFLTQKGGTGKTTLAASFAVAAAEAGEKVIAFDVDPQLSLVRWGERRKAAGVKSSIVTEPLERERLSRLRAIFDGIAGVGFTVAIFDVGGTDGAAARQLTECVDLCLLPTRPTCLDLEATAATFRRAFLRNRKAAFVLNQCSATYRSARAGEVAKHLVRLGVLAEPMLTARVDHQDAIAEGLGVTEYAGDSRGAQEIRALWRWVDAQLATGKRNPPADNLVRQVVAA
jgi:chromosome partitioning protein